MDQYIAIGSTKKVYGVKGELKLAVNEQYIDDLLQTEVIFLQNIGQPMPYFVEEISFKGQLIIKLEEVDSPEAARELAGKELLLRAADVLVAEDNQPQASGDLEYGHFVGFTLVDAIHGEVGLIESIESYPQQEMAVVKSAAQQWLIPLNDAFIGKVDEKAKKLLVALPEGLLDL